MPPPKRESRVRVDRSISLRETKQTPNQIDNIDNQKEKKGVQRNRWLTFFDNFKMILSVVYIPNDSKDNILVFTVSKTSEIKILVFLKFIRILYNFSPVLNNSCQSFCENSLGSKTNSKRKHKFEKN